MKRSYLAGSAWGGMLAVLVAAALALAACGGTSTTAASSSPPPVVGASPSAASPASAAGSWQPGADSLAATTKVATQWLTTLRGERFAASDLWAGRATFDLWASDAHASGGDAVKAVYVDAAPDSSWTAGHALVSPGVAAYEGLFASGDLKPTAALDLVAVSGGKILHEEIYLDTSGGRSAEPVTQWPSPPTSADTVARTKKTAATFSEAMATSDTLTMGRLLADDVLFYDTAQKRERHSATALLTWWNGRTAVTWENRPQDGLIVGRGWAALRWTANGAQTSTENVAMPSATVLETRGGKVVRMTLYYDSATLQLHM